jgi:hypothetical protein
VLIVGYVAMIEHVACIPMANKHNMPCLFKFYSNTFSVSDINGVKLTLKKYLIFKGVDVVIDLRIL